MICKKMTYEEQVEMLHRKQKVTNADISCLRLISENGSVLDLEVGGDGECKFCIVESEDEIPSYYNRLKLSIKGRWKIMNYDCFTKYEDDGTEISSIYDYSIYIYQAGRSFIFYCFEG